jgi:hypothetical protein
MAAFATYSTTAATNVTIRGVNAAENCAAANQNDLARALAAEGRELYDLVAAIDTSTLMPKAGGAFTGSVTRSGAGAFPYWNSSSLTGGAMYIQLTTDALPSSPAEGTIVFQY